MLQQAVYSYILVITNWLQSFSAGLGCTAQTINFSHTAGLGALYVRECIDGYYKFKILTS
jgi:hypothetical protein